MALDVVRGLTINRDVAESQPRFVGIQLFLAWCTPKWEGWTLIDMGRAGVPVLYRGARLPLSFSRRVEKARNGAPRCCRHILWRALALIAIGFFLISIPRFDFATVRIPQRAVAHRPVLPASRCFIVLTSRLRNGAIALRPALIAGVAGFILLSVLGLAVLLRARAGFGARALRSGR